MPKLSIIIPIYNVEEYLDQCVQSAINQTLQDIEIILVDDESPDSCPQMCDDYAKQDSRIKVVHKKNGGLGFARNSGLEVATGEYVTFLDSDDFVDLHTYEHLYNIAKTENLDAIFYKFKRFTNENEVVDEKPINDITKYEGENIKDLMLDIIASEPSAKVDHKIQCSSCTAMYRLAIIKEKNVRFHSERELISEDMIFNLDFLKHTTIVAFNNGEHYHYRVNVSSLTSAVRSDRFEKNLIQYNYLKENIKTWDLDKTKANERCARFLIGYSRTAISQYLCSNIEWRGKKRWLKNILNKDIWYNLNGEYDWKELPLYPQIFFKFCIKKSYTLLFILCKTISTIKRVL